MTTDLGPLAYSPTEPTFPRHATARATTERWTETTGAHLLIVDPSVDDHQLRDDMTARGVHVTCVCSTVDALIMYGRNNPNAVIVAPEASGLPAAEFIAKIREYGAPFVVVALDPSAASEAGPLMLAGAGAAIPRPYTAEAIWELLQRFNHALDDHARLTFGPIELDARAFTVRVHGERIGDLPLKEFELLRVLMYRAPEVLTDQEIRASLWGDTATIADNTIASHAARVRNRLQGIARVRRVRGHGYSLSLG